jgi:2-polyprenyl-3-methyl-5-hydroxy-6-metoxy-1,4-benzoquinol methylase
LLQVQVIWSILKYLPAGDMNVQEAYRHWSGHYDTDVNKTRDLEAVSLRDMLSSVYFEKCLEIGCGTGKNTEWLISKGDHILAVDISDEMLALAKHKVPFEKVTFIRADVTEPWEFTCETFDLVVFSLVLEHIENLDFIFRQVSDHLREEGTIYVGELHPFRQYLGSKASFESDTGEHLVSVHTHHITDFTYAASRNGLRIEEIKEYFDNDDRSKSPRILALKFKKLSSF